MNPNITNLVAQFTAFLIIWTLVLLAARRYGQVRGMQRVQTAAGLLWWLGVDGLLMLCSFFLAQSAYAIWMPSDGALEDLSPLLHNWFAGSQLEIADIFALAVTLLVFGIAHSFVYCSVVARQSLSAPEAIRPERSVVISYIVGSVVLGSILYYMLRNWEAPVIAIRIAQMVGSDRFDGVLEDILSISNVWDEVISKSWLLTSISWAWSIMIVFTAWATVKSHIAFDNALNAPDTGDVADAIQGDQAAVQTVVSDRSERRAPLVADMDDVIHPAAFPNGGRVVEQETAAHDTQALIDQNSELQDKVEQYQRENEAHRARVAANPMDLPNITAPTEPHTPHISVREETDDSILAASPFSRNGNTPH